MKKPDFENGEEAILNGSGDLAIMGNVKSSIGQRVVVVGKNRSGLYRIQTKEGEIFTGIPKYNLDRNNENLKHGFISNIDTSMYSVDDALVLDPKTNELKVRS